MVWLIVALFFWLVCPSILTNETLLGTLNFQNFFFVWLSWVKTSSAGLVLRSQASPNKTTRPNRFFRFIVFKNQLQNKPNLHIKEANLLKMRFIPYKLPGI